MICLRRFDDNRHRINQFCHLGVADPVRRRDDNFIAPAAQRLEGIVERMFRPAGNEYLSWLEVEVVVPAKFLSDCLQQLGNPLVRRVLCEILLNGLDTRVLDKLWRREIGFSSGQTHHVDTIGLHLLGPGKEPHRGGTFNIRKFF